MENKTETNDQILWKAQWDIFMRLLPVTVCLFALIFVGIVGNIVTIVFYVKHLYGHRQTVLITCLAVADLATCFAAIPVISEMIINVRYSQNLLCKLSHCLGVWAGASSCFILWTISIDRYRRICIPLGKQMTVTTVKYLVIGITTFSLLLSIRILVTFDTVEVNVTVPNKNYTAVGLYCAAREDHSFKLVGLIFYVIEFLLILMVWTTVVATFSKIIYTIVRRRNAMGKVSLFLQSGRRAVETRCGRKSVNGNDSKEEDETTNAEYYTSGGFNSLAETSMGDTLSPKDSACQANVYAIAQSDHEQFKQQRNNRVRKVDESSFNFTSIKHPSEVNLTLMMFAVAVVFIFVLHSLLCCKNFHKDSSCDRK